MDFNDLSDHLGTVNKGGREVAFGNTAMMFPCEHGHPGRLLFLKWGPAVTFWHELS